jgi:hypothetical protein
MGIQIKMDLKEIDCEGVDLINLDKNTDRWRVFVNSKMNFGVS